MSVIKTIIGGSSSQVEDISVRVPISHIVIVGYWNGAAVCVKNEKISIKTNGGDGVSPIVVCGKAKILDLANYATSGEGFYINCEQPAPGSFVSNVLNFGVLPEHPQWGNASVVLPILVSPNGGYSLKNQEYLSVSLYDLEPSLHYEVYAFQSVGGGTLIQYDEFAIPPFEQKRQLEVGIYDVVLLPEKNLEEITLTFPGASSGITKSRNELVIMAIMSNDISGLRTDLLDVGSSPVLAVSCASAHTLQVVCKQPTGYSFMVVNSND